MKVFFCALLVALLYLCPSPAAAASNKSGAYVATLGQLAGVATDFTFSIPGASDWTASRDLTNFDFSISIDVAPGSGNTWTFTLEYATLSSTQYCSDISSWTSVSLGTISGATQKGFTVTNQAVNIVAPACLHGRAIFSGNSRNDLGGGTASFYFNSGPMHFQGSGGDTVSGSVFYGGNVFRSPDEDRAYWIATGNTLSSVSGIVAVPTAPGSGHTWTIEVATSTAALAANQNCNDLTYTKTNVGTITGTTQKLLHFTATSVSVPTGGCVQVIGTCTGGTCSSGSISPSYGLDFTTSDITFETAGSGAFDANHQFGIGPWAISDRKPTAGAAVLGQQYWAAPSVALNFMSGSFTFTSAVGGTGQYNIGVTVSTTAPSSTQGCLDLSYTNSSTLCSIASGSKSCTFAMTPISIPAYSCFALNVSTSGGTPTQTGQFNWQATGVSQGTSSMAGNTQISGKAAIK